MGLSHIDTIFEIEGVTVIDVENHKNEQKIFGQLKRERQCCPKCHSNKTIFRDKKTRQFHLPPVGQKKCDLYISVKRCHCKLCSYTWWPQMPFTDGKRRVSRSFVNYAIDLMRMGTIDDVARHLGVGWDLIKDLHKEYLRKEYKEIDLSDVEYICLDEFSIRKGHNYMSVFSDLKSGRVLHTVEGRKKEDLEPFLRLLKKKHLILKQ